MQDTVLVLETIYRYHNIFFIQFSAVNLNNMLCPAVSDPFHGRYYRLFAMSHQLLLIPCLGKVYVVLAKHLPVIRSPSKKHLQEVSVWAADTRKESSRSHVNSHQRGDNSDRLQMNGQYKTHHREHSNGHVKTS